MNDARMIMSFIDEVSKNHETKESLEGRGDIPTANWLHVFDGFRGIREVLDPIILGGLDVPDAAGRKALQTLVLDVLRRLLPKISGQALMPTGFIRNLAKELDLKADEIGRSKQLDSKTWGHLVMLGVMASKPPIDVQPLQNVLSTNLLMKYDSQASSFEVTEEFGLLAKLVQDIAHYNSARARDWAELIKYGRATGSVTVPVHLVASELNLLFSWCSVVERAKALAANLGGIKTALPTHLPKSVFADQEQQLEQEAVSMDEVRAFVGLG